MTGLHLSHYAIEAELGRGGMGIVYRAKDTKLNRTIALKVLPAGALASEDDRARFRREAQASAQLNHPNVCHVYQVDEAQPLTPDGKPVEGHMEPRLFIAMEYIEGQTLHDHVKKGPLKLQEAVNIAGQIAEALKEAHGKDIVHRDIKSANIMLTEAGVAKVLDFGLAKTNQSTMLTRMGSTLGTVAYMSPEQARGQEVDGRSDLYSLGTVLYEMVAGRLPFSGDYEQAVLYGILNEAPEPLTAVRTGVPMQLEWIVDKLLKKEAEYRYQSAAGLLADLKSLDLSGSGLSRRSMPAVSAAGMAPVPGGESGVPRWIWLCLAGALIVGLATGWLTRPSHAPAADRPTLNVDISIAGYTGARYPELSSDARYFAFGSSDSSSAQPTLVIHDLTTNRKTRIPNSAYPETPRFSPDDSQICFQSGGQLKIVETSGGDPVPIARTDRPGCVWGPDRTIYFSANDGIRSVGPDGSNRLLAGTDTFPALQFASDWLPSGHLLVTVGPPDASGAVAIDPETGARFDVLPAPAAFYARMLGDDILLVQDGNESQVLAYPLDPGSARVLDRPVSVMNKTMWYTWGVSRAGDLVRLGGAGGPTRRLVTVSASGEQALGTESADFEELRVSPDRRRIVVEANNYRGTLDQILILDRETLNLRQLTLEGGIDPTWSPDGERIAYGFWGGDRRIGIRNADGSGQTRPLPTEGLNQQSQPDFSPDGRFIVFRSARDDTETLTDIWRFDFSDSTLSVVRADPAHQQWPRYSADGRYIAYESSETGSGQIFVMTADGSSKWPVTQAGGGRPVWSDDDRAIYYKRGGSIWSIPVDISGVFRLAGVPREVVPIGSGTLFDVDGSGFVLSRGESIEAFQANLTLNWERQVRERLPALSSRD